MQIRTFTIPVLGGELLSEEMNVFLRSKKILRVREHLVNNDSEGVFWCYSVHYVDDVSVTEREKVRVDYREVLDEPSFKRFCSLREIRKKVAIDDVVPAYTVLTDAEMAELAKLEVVTLEALKGIKGIGERKIEKYAQYFLSKTKDEKSE
jgi:superfamily II DNA helicase RecQ